MPPLELTEFQKRSKSFDLAIKEHNEQAIRSYLEADDVKELLLKTNDVWPWIYAALTDHSFPLSLFQLLIDATIKHDMVKPVLGDPIDTRKHQMLASIPPLIIFATKNYIKYEQLKLLLETCEKHCLPELISNLFASGPGGTTWLLESSISYEALELLFTFSERYVRKSATTMWVFLERVYEGENCIMRAISRKWPVKYFNLLMTFCGKWGVDFDKMLAYKNRDKQNSLLIVIKHSDKNKESLELLIIIIAYFSTARKFSAALNDRKYASDEETEISALLFAQASAGQLVHPHKLLNLEKPAQTWKNCNQLYRDRFGVFPEAVRAMSDTFVSEPEDKKCVIQ